MQLLGGRNRWLQAIVLTTSQAATPKGELLSLFQIPGLKTSRLRLSGEVWLQPVPWCFRNLLYPPLWSPPKGRNFPAWWAPRRAWAVLEDERVLCNSTAFYQPKASLRTGAPGMPASLTQHRHMLQEPRPLGGHGLQPVPLAHSKNHNKQQVSAKHLRNPFSQLLHISSNWKQSACPALTQDENTNYSVNSLNTIQ